MNKFNFSLPNSDLEYGNMIPTFNISAEQGFNRPLNIGSIESFGKPSDIGSIGSFGSIGGQDSGKSTLESLGGYGGVAKILADLGGLYLGFQQQKLAKNALNFEKNAFNQSMSANKKAFNNNLADRINSRFSITGKSQEEADQLIEERSL